MNLAQLSGVVLYCSRVGSDLGGVFVLDVLAPRTNAREVHCFGDCGLGRDSTRDVPILD